MDDALLVRRFERLGDLLARSAAPRRAGSRPRAMRCDRSSPSTSSITRAVTPSLLRARRSRRCSDDSATRGLRLRAGSARAGRRRRRTRRRQDLDRDLALQLRVGRAIHLAHAAFADRRGDFVDAEAGAGGQGQVWRDYSRWRTAILSRLQANIYLSPPRATCRISWGNSMPPHSWRRGGSARAALGVALWLPLFHSRSHLPRAVLLDDIDAADDGLLGTVHAFQGECGAGRGRGFLDDLTSVCVP